MFPAPRLIVSGFLGGFVVVAGWLILTAHTRLFAATDRSEFIGYAYQSQWRGLLLRSALRRADELNRLRELPDTPVPPVIAPEPPEPTDSQIKTADLPTNAGDATPEDAPAPVLETPSMAIPVEIGETSSTELPVAHPSEMLPQPQRIRPSTSAKPAAKVVRRHHRRRPQTQTAATPGPTLPNQQTNPFFLLFEGALTRPAAQPPQPPAKTRAASRKLRSIKQSPGDRAATAAATR